MRAFVPNTLASKTAAKSTGGYLQLAADWGPYLAVGVTPQAVHSASATATMRPSLTQQTSHRHQSSQGKSVSMS